MTTAIIFHEVKNGENWAESWRKGKGSRHEMFGLIGIKVRTFRDPKSPDHVGVIMEIPDMAKFQTFMESDEAKKAMAQDGVKPETLQLLTEFMP